MRAARRRRKQPSEVECRAKARRRSGNARFGTHVTGLLKRQRAERHDSDYRGPGRKLADLARDIRVVMGAYIYADACEV